jgi:GDSL-like Lipase/Acylhydrolase family
MALRRGVESGKGQRLIRSLVIAEALFAPLVSCASDHAEASPEATAPELRSATPTMTAPDPMSSSVFLGGDSLTFTAIWDQGTGEGAPADLTWAAWLGWTAADVQPQLERAVALGQADTVVLALGVNDSSPTGGDGWTTTDVDRFQRLLDAPQPAACVVIVLPGYGDGVGPEHAAELDEARDDLQDLANQRRQQAGYGPTVLVDWQATLDAQPDLVADDGIHLASDPVTGDVSAEAAAARTGLYWQGVSACADR